MDNTTYMIWDASTDTIIARGMPRDNTLDLLGMLMAWNKGVQAWQVQVDYCEEEANCLQGVQTAMDILASAPTDAEILLTPEEQTLLGKQIAEIKEKFNPFTKQEGKE